MWGWIIYRQETTTSSTIYCEGTKYVGIDFSMGPKLLMNLSNVQLYEANLCVIQTNIYSRIYAFSINLKKKCLRRLLQRPHFGMGNVTKIPMYMLEKYRMLALVLWHTFGKMTKTQSLYTYSGLRRLCPRPRHQHHHFQPSVNWIRSRALRNEETTYCSVSICC